MAQKFSNTIAGSAIPRRKRYCCAQILTSPMRAPVQRAGSLRRFRQNLRMAQAFAWSSLRKAILRTPKSAKRSLGWKYYTTGGRVLSVGAIAADLPAASKIAYEAAGKVRIAGAHYRKDIGTSKAP